MRKLFCCLDNRYFLEVGMVARARTASRDALPKKEGASISAVKLPLIKPNLFSKDATNWFPRDDIRLLAGAYKVVFLLLEIISSGSASDGPKWHSFRKKRLFITHKYLTFIFKNQNGQKSIKSFNNKSKYRHNQKCVVVVEIIYGQTETFFVK